MATNSQQAATKQGGVARPAPAGARYEIVFDRRPPGTTALPDFIATLKRLSERGGAALGDGYARLARSLLNRLERLEDLNAERRAQRRSGGRPERSRTPRLPARRTQSAPPVKEAP